MGLSLVQDSVRPSRGTTDYPQPGPQCGPARGGLPFTHACEYTRFGWSDGGSPLARPLVRYGGGAVLRPQPHAREQEQHQRNRYGQGEGYRLSYLVAGRKLL